MVFLHSGFFFPNLLPILIYAIWGNLMHYNLPIVETVRFGGNITVSGIWMEMMMKSYATSNSFHATPHNIEEPESLVSWEKDKF